MTVTVMSEYPLYINFTAGHCVVCCDLPVRADQATVRQPPAVGQQAGQGRHHGAGGAAAAAHLRCRLTTEASSVIIRDNLTKSWRTFPFPFSSPDESDAVHGPATVSAGLVGGGRGPGGGPPRGLSRLVTLSIELGYAQLIKCFDMTDRMCKTAEAAFQSDRKIQCTWFNVKGVGTQAFRRLVP